MNRPVYLLCLTHWLAACVGPVFVGFLLVSGCGNGTETFDDTSSETRPPAIDFTWSDFSLFPPKADWSGNGREFRTDGTPKGYAYSSQEIGPGELSFEYRFPGGVPEITDPNTGLLLFIAGEHKKWPDCIEVQGKQSESGRVKANGGRAEPEVLHDEKALSTAPNPPGEWNSVVVTITPDGLAARLNGQLTASAVKLDGVTGPFGLQAEGNAVEFRNVRFQPAAETNAETNAE